MRVFILLLNLLLLTGVVHAEDSDEQNKMQEMEYLEMKPKFTVNLAERRKYLMVNVQLLLEDDKAIAKVKKHMPMLRHELIMLYSGLASTDIQSVDQREQLRLQSKQKITEALDKYADSKGVLDIYFTEFLVN